MDFIPFNASVFTLGALFTPGVLFCAGGLLAMAAVVFIIRMLPKDKLAQGQPARKTMVTLIAVGMASLFVSLPFNFTESREAIIAVADHHQAVADGFTEHYGVKVTAEDVEEMDYPTREPEEERVGSTVTLGSGMKVTLVVDDGKARLYRLGEELPVAD